VLRRLRRKAADERSLARWCDVCLDAIRPVLAQLKREGLIFESRGRYDVPRNIAGPITIPQFRWGSTRLG
jgi:hypothetical protein